MSSNIPLGRQLIIGSFITGAIHWRGSLLDVWTDPAPSDYLCMALASCTAMTLRMYIQRKKWSVDTISVKVSLKKGNELPAGTDTFYGEISFTGDINEEQQQRMLHVAKSCPISRLLQKQNEVITVITNIDRSVFLKEQKATVVY